MTTCPEAARDLDSNLNLAHAFPKASSSPCPSQVVFLGAPIPETSPMDESPASDDPAASASLKVADDSTRWFMEQHSQIAEHMNRFVHESKVHLEQHQRRVDQFLFLQRLQMKSVAPPAKSVEYASFLQGTHSFRSSRSRIKTRELEGIGEYHPVRLSQSASDPACEGAELSLDGACSLSCPGRLGEDNFSANNSWTDTLSPPLSPGFDPDFIPHSPQSMSPSVSNFLRQSPADEEGEQSIRLRAAYESAERMINSPRFSGSVERLSHKAMRSGLVIQRTVNSTTLFGLECAVDFVESGKFKIFFAVLVVLNAVFITTTSEFALRNAWLRRSHGDSLYAEIENSSSLLFLDTFFNLLFLLELILRIVALEGRFFLGADWRWNLFDCALVAFSVLEMIIMIMGQGYVYFRALRIARAVILLRTLRLLRYTSLIRRLRVMSLAIMNSRMMLIWAILVLFFVVFLFAVVFLNAVATYINDAGESDPHVPEMKVFFSSLSMTMLSLFMAISGGFDWWTLVNLLLQIHVVYAMIFILYVVLTLLAVLNVIHAIFVHDAMETTRKDVDLRMQWELEETKQMLERLTRIFREMDHAATENITEFVFVTQVEREDMKLLFSLLGLYFTDGLTLFRLLDADNDGLLGIDEFVMGCMRLRNGSNLIDTEVLIKDTKRILKEVAQDHKRDILAVATSVTRLCDSLGIASPPQARLSSVSSGHVGTPRPSRDRARISGFS